MRRRMKGAHVKIYDLVKRFDDVLAVDNVSLNIAPGEFLTLLGPSGSGKTTTLMMIAGFEIPDSGQILVDDEPIMFRPAYKRDIGMVFQHYSLFPHMTVERNIGFPLRMRKTEKSEALKRIDQVLELVKLPGYGHRLPKQLSGGQQQRVALARALVFNPHVLLMDEPLGALDKKLREHMQIEIKQITSALNITVIYVTHDQSEAMTMSDRIAVMNEGKIIQVGTPAEIYERPSSYFVADFIGESNFIEGAVEEVNGKKCTFKTNDGFSCKVNPSYERIVGEKGHLVIRPEKISIIYDEEHFSNIFHGQVEGAFYLGDITAYRVKLSNSQTELLVKKQNKYTSDQIEKGDKIFVGWNEVDNCIV